MSKVLLHYTFKYLVFKLSFGLKQKQTNKKRLGYLFLRIPRNIHLSRKCWAKQICVIKDATNVVLNRESLKEPIYD